MPADPQTNVTGSNAPNSKDRDPDSRAGGPMGDRGRNFGNAQHDPARHVHLRVDHVDFWYGEKHALKDVSLDIHGQEVTALIGPPGCGKSTLLRCLNRMNDLSRDTRLTGSIQLAGLDICQAFPDPTDLRAKFGWIAQKPDPLPDSIYDNVAYGMRLRGMVDDEADCDRRVEDALRQAGLWEEVKDCLEEPGIDLAGGQQQLLCIARALACAPEVILMDEPCSALDPIAAMHVEDLILTLKQRYTIVIVTHNMQQAARVSQRTAFMHQGRLLEAGETEQVLLAPETDLCRDYITGRYD